MAHGVYTTSDGGTGKSRSLGQVKVMGSTFAETLKLPIHEVRVHMMSWGHVRLKVIDLLMISLT